MAIIDDLNAQYASYRAAQLAQLRTLAATADKMVSGFGHYVGLSNPAWQNPKTKEWQDYVRLGKGDEKNFQEVDHLNLTSFDGAVDFSVSITLEIGAHNYPKMNIIFPLSVREIEGGFEFSGKDFPGLMLVSSSDASVGNFQSVYVAFVDKIARMYDVKELAPKAR